MMDDPEDPTNISSPPEPAANQESNKPSEALDQRPTREFVELPEETPEEEYSALNVAEFRVPMSVALPAEQEGFAILNRDWEALKVDIRRIPPHSRKLEIIAAVMVGIATEALFALFAFYSMDPYPRRFIFITWIIFLVTAILAPVLYWLHLWQAGMVPSSVESVIDRMNSIEEVYRPQRDPDA